jgi:uncharacterized OB-fold protein
MTAGVTISACRSCGWKGLPERLWCPRCGGAEVGAAQVLEGTLEELTTARRGGGPSSPVRVASVRIEGGGALIVRLEGTAAAGGLVDLEDDAGAAVARAQGAMGV